MDSSHQMALLKRCLNVLSLFIAGLGLFSTTVWMTGHAQLLQWPPSHWPISTGTSVTLLFSGLGFFSILRRPQSRIKEWCALPLFVLSTWRILTLSQEDPAVPFRFLSLWIHFIFPVTRTISLFSAVCFFCIALILILWPKESDHTLRRFAVIILSSLVLSLSILGACFYTIPIPGFGYRPDFIFVQFYTTLCLAFLSLGFLVWIWRQDHITNAQKNYWLVCFVPLQILSLTIVINVVFTTSSHKSLQEIATSKNHQALFLYREKISSIHTFLMQLTHQSLAHSRSDPEWQEEEQTFFTEHPEVELLVLLDSQNKIIDHLSNSKTDSSFLLILLHERPFSFSVGSSYHFDRNHLYLVIGGKNGTQTHENKEWVAIINMDRFFHWIATLIQPRYVFSVQDSAGELYTSISKEERILPYQSSPLLSVENPRFEFRVTPTTATFTYRIQQFLTITLVLAGSILAVGVGYLLFWKHSWKTQARKAQNILRITEDLLKMLNDPQEVPEACHKLLFLLNRLRPWDALVLWRWNPLKSRLEHVHTVYSGSIRFPHLEDHIRAPSPCEGERLPYHIYLEGEPLIIPNLGENKVFACATPAHLDGIQGTLAFPLFVGDVVSGAIIIFKTTEFVAEEEPEVVDLMPSIGIQFGQFIHRQEVEALAREAELAVNYSAEAIFTLDVEGNVKSWNPGAEKMYGWTREEILNKSIFDLTFPEAHLEEREQRKKILKEGVQVLDWEGQRVRKDGSLIWIHISNAPIRNASGKIMGSVAVAKDITERIAIERSKDEFVSMVSHELRSPLTSIKGAVGLLSSEHALSDRAKELLTLAHRNIDRLTRLVNDILDLEKLQLGKITLQNTEFPLVKALREALTAMHPLAQQAQVVLKEEAMLETLSIICDYQRLIQVLLNLLTNAISFSPKNGTVTLSMASFDHRVRISVHDEGKGIPKEFQSHIFSKFAQADRGDTRIAKGTGLGLSICKELITLMGGTIGFTTKEQEGTTFFFELPLNNP